MTLAEYLRDARNRRRLSIRELATRAKLKPSTIVRIEAGTSSPRTDTLSSILGVLCLSESELVELVGLL